MAGENRNQKESYTISMFLSVSESFTEKMSE